MPNLTIRHRHFEPLDALHLRMQGAYEQTVTTEGPLVSDNRILFNTHFVRQDAADVAVELAKQRADDHALYDQDAVRKHLRTVRKEAAVEGELLGHVAPVPALCVRAERLAGVRFRERRGDSWKYVWVDAHRLRLLAELFLAPLRFFCASWNHPLVLKRGKRTVACIAPAARHPLDVRVTR